MSRRVRSRLRSRRERAGAAGDEALIAGGIRFHNCTCVHHWDGIAWAPHPSLTPGVTPLERRGAPTPPGASRRDLDARGRGRRGTARAPVSRLPGVLVLVAPP